MRCCLVWKAPISGVVQCLEDQLNHGEKHQNGRAWLSVGYERLVQHEWI